MRTGVFKTQLLVGLLGLGASACSQSRLNLIWPPELEEAFVVLAPADWRGDTNQLLIQGPISPGSASRMQLELTDDGQIYLLSPSRSGARVRHPRLSEPARWRLEALSPELFGDPSCGAEGWAHQDLELELPLATPEGGSLAFELDPEASVFAAIEETPFDTRLSYRGPLEPCFGGRRIAVAPFAEGTDDAASTLLSYGGVQLITEDTVLAWSVDTADVIVRDEAQGRERRIRTSDFGVPAPPADEIWRIDGAAMIGSSSSAVGIISLSRGSFEGEGTTEARIYEIGLRPDGLFAGRELWRTNEPGRESLHRIERVAIDSRGWWVGSGEGLVLTASSASTAPTVHREAPSFDGSYLSSTRSSPRSFVLGGRGYLRWFTPELGADGFENVSTPILSSSDRILDAIAVRQDQSGPSLFAVSSSLNIAHLDSGGAGWTQLSAPGTEIETRCPPTRRCGRPLLNQRTEFIAGEPSHESPAAWVSPYHCGVLYVVDVEEACAVSAAIELTEEIIGGARDLGDILGADVLGNTTVVVGERGRILDVRLE